MTGSDPTQVEDVDDDLTRELAFYNQACAAPQPHCLCGVSL